MSSGEKNDRVVTNIDAIVLAIFELGGDQSLVDEEDVALRADEIAPGQFRWKKHTDRVNLYTARLALKDAKRSGLVRGTHTHGWQLTPSGLDWTARIAGSGRRARPEAVNRKADKRRRIERLRLVELPAAKKFARGAPVSPREARAVFRIDEYTSEQRQHESIERALMLFKGDEEIGPFVELMAEILRSPQ